MIKANSNSYCVYMHWNMLNGKMYIGQTKDIKKRWKCCGLMYQGKIKEAFDKYGWNNFWHEILEDGLTQKEAYVREAYYIKKFGSVKMGYNTEPASSRPLTLYDPKTQKLLRFKTRKAAAEFINPEGVESARVCMRHCVSDTRGEKTYKGYYVFDGLLNKQEVINKIKQTKNQTSRRFREITAFFPDGSSQTFVSKAECSRALNIPISSLKYCIANDTAYNEKITFKLSEPAPFKLKATNQTTGEVRYFNTTYEFAAFTGCSNSNVSIVLKRPEKRSVHGWKLQLVA